MLNNLKNISNRLNTMDAQDEFKFKSIDIDLILPSKKNLYGIRDIEDLAADIKENGLYHNLVVRELEDGCFEIISGERRYRALKQLDIKKVPCQVRVANDLDFEIMLIQSNAKTRELTNGEKLKQVERLKALYAEKRGLGVRFEGKTRDLIGKDLGMSGVQAGRYMKISEKLDEPLKEKFKNDELTLREADKLSSIPKEKQQEEYEVLKVETVREKKFVPEGMETKKEIQRLEKAAGPIKEVLTSLKNDINIEEKVKELIEFTNQHSTDSITCRSSIIVKADGTVMSFRKKINLAVISQRIMLSSMALTMQVEFKNIEEIAITENTAKLVTKSMIIEL